MNIGIDISAMGEPNYTGVGIYVQNIIKNLAKIDKKNQYYLCYRLSRLKKKWLANPVDQKNFHFKVIQEPFNFLFQRKLDVFHGPGERIPSYPHPKKVVTIHDMAALKGGDFMTDSFREMVRGRYKELVVDGKADAIVTVSESSKKDICDYYQIDSSKIKVVYEGVDSIFREKPEEDIGDMLHKYNIDAPYILNVGAQQERKNIVGLIKAYSGFLKSGGDAKLVLCGKATYGYERIPKTIAELGLENRIIIIGHVSQEELVSLYSGAMMFCFPSFYEGFGLPLVEAFACGCPVITSNLTSMPEIAGGAAEIIDPHDTARITKAMLKLSDPEEAEKLKQKGLERAKFFNWEQTAKGLLEVYKSVV